MDKPVLYRKRLIPDECIELKGDQILRCDEDVIVTSWRAIHPKPDLDHGYSAYFLKEGIKVSQFLHADGSLLYWYCDIVNYEFNTSGTSLTATDLLADVVVYPDGFVKVLDLDELAEAAQRKLIDETTLHEVLVRVNKLLTTIYNGNFKKYQEPIFSASADMDS